MSIEQFEELAPIEFYLALKDHEQVELFRTKYIAEAIRMQTWWQVNMWLKRTKQIRKSEKFMQFPWDRFRKAIQQTPDQMKRMMKMIAGGTKNRERKGKSPRHEKPVGSKT